MGYSSKPDLQEALTLIRLTICLKSFTFNLQKASLGEKKKKIAAVELEGGVEG